MRTADEGLACFYIARDKCDGCNVHNNAADVCGQLSGRNFSACCGLNHHFFCALRIFGFKDHKLDFVINVILVVCNIFENFKSLGLVIFNSDNNLLEAEKLFKQINTGKNIP